MATVICYLVAWRECELNFVPISASELTLASVLQEIDNCCIEVNILPVQSSIIFTQK